MPQYVQLRFVRAAFELRPIGFHRFVARVGNFGLQAAVSREQQQAFAVGVQPPGGINIGQSDKLFQRAVFFVRAELADNPIGLVEND